MTRLFTTLRPPTDFDLHTTLRFRSGLTRFSSSFTLVLLLAFGLETQSLLEVSRLPFLSDDLSSRLIVDCSALSTSSLLQECRRVQGCRKRKTKDPSNLRPWTSTQGHVGIEGVTGTHRMFISDEDSTGLSQMRNVDSRFDRGSECDFPVRIRPGKGRVY